MNTETVTKMLQACIDYKAMVDALEKENAALKLDCGKLRDALERIAALRGIAPDSAADSMREIAAAALAADTAGGAS